MMSIQCIHNQKTSHQQGFLPLFNVVLIGNSPPHPPEWKNSFFTCLFLRQVLQVLVVCQNLKNLHQGEWDEGWYQSVTLVCMPIRCRYGCCLVGNLHCPEALWGIMQMYTLKTGQSTCACIIIVV